MSDLFLVKLMSLGDCYYKTTMARRMLNTPEMNNLREHAHKHGFGLEFERLSTIKEMEKFLAMYDTVDER